MHSYELEGRQWMAVALAGISVALVWLLDLGLSIFEYQPRCWMNLPCIGAFYSVLYLAFDHYIWKLGSLRSENNPLTQTNPVVPDRFRQDRWTNPGGNTSMLNLSETGSIMRRYGISTQWEGDASRRGSKYPVSRAVATPRPVGQGRATQPRGYS